MMRTRAVVLAGGVGAARFLQGLVQIAAPEAITAIVNTGDDAEFYGLHVSPDLDTVMYTLAGVVNPEAGWGRLGDTFACLEALATYGEETWFKLGDRDLATHLRRTSLLRRGWPLSRVTAELGRALGVGVRLLPMTDDPVHTEIETPSGTLPFQEYFVKRRQEDEVCAVQVRGASTARPAPGTLEAIAEAEAVIIAPSNPFVSIGPILALPGLRAALAARRAATVAVSPIIGGAAVKGPADRMLRSLGVEVSAFGVASLYTDVVGTFVLDDVDASLAPRVEGLGMHAVVAQTLMRTPAATRALVQSVLDAVRRS